MKQLQSYISFKVTERNVLILFIALFSVVTTLISKQHFCRFLLQYLKYAHQISPPKSEKYD